MVKELYKKLFPRLKSPNPIPSFQIKVRSKNFEENISGTKFFCINKLHTF